MSILGHVLGCEGYVTDRVMYVYGFVSNGPIFSYDKGCFISDTSTTDFCPYKYRVLKELCYRFSSQRSVMKS